MVGLRQEAQSTLFYEFSIEIHVPFDHVFRTIDGVINVSNVRGHLSGFYSSTGRRLCDEVRLNLGSGPINFLHVFQWIELLLFKTGEQHVGSILAQRSADFTGFPLLSPPALYPTCR